MKQDEIIEMARQVGFQVDEYAKQFQPSFISWGGYSIHKELEAFAKLVAAKEREACAKLFPQPHMEYFGQDIQDAIRARGE
jgi:hypothetical protein